MRRAARTDANHLDIVNALWKAGATVQSLAAVGNGVPDLLVGFRGALMLIEVKDGEKSPSRRALTDEQVKWHKTWAGYPLHVVNSVDDALRAIGAMR